MTFKMNELVHGDLTSYIKFRKITSGKDFLLVCMHHFGALVILKADEKSPSGYTPCVRSYEKDWKDHYNHAIQKLNDWCNQSDEEIRFMAMLDHKDLIWKAETEISEMKEDNERYEKILNEILAWNPADEDCVALRYFAIKTIKKSIHPAESFAQWQKVLDTPYDNSDEAVQKFFDKTKSKLLNDLKQERVLHDGVILKAHKVSELIDKVKRSLEENNTKG